MNDRIENYLFDKRLEKIDANRNTRRYNRHVARKALFNNGMLRIKKMGKLVELIYNECFIALLHGPYRNKIVDAVATLLNSQKEE